DRARPAVHRLRRRAAARLLLETLPAQKALPRRRSYLRAPSRGASAQALCLGAGPARLGKNKTCPGQGPGQVRKRRETIGAETVRYRFAEDAPLRDACPPPGPRLPVCPRPPPAPACLSPAPACLSPAPPERWPLRDPLEAPLRGA